MVPKKKKDGVVVVRKHIKDQAKGWRKFTWTNTTTNLRRLMAYGRR
jgi:hypothetical protein